MVIIKPKKEYITVTSKEENEKEIIYNFKMKEKEIIILNFDSIYNTQVGGIVVLDDHTITISPLPDDNLEVVKL